jgi:hypothetical protein
MSHPKPHGPRLETLLDQRDRLGIEITSAENDGRTTDYDVGNLRRKLLLIDHAIIQQWDDSAA